MVERVEAELQRHLSEKDLTLGSSRRIISLTPDLLEKQDFLPTKPENSHESRTDEILIWLRENAVYEPRTKRCGRMLVSSSHRIEKIKNGYVKEPDWRLECKIKVSRFVIIDDMDLTQQSCYRQRAEISKYFVKTDTSVGLTTSKVEAAAQILSNLSFDFNKWARMCFQPCTNRTCEAPS